MMTEPTERPLTPDEVSVFQRYREMGLRMLQASEFAEPETLVRDINAYVDQWQSKRRGFIARLRSRTEDTTDMARALSVVWGDQIVRRFHWEWICEVRDGEERYAVSPPDRSLVIYAPQFMSECLEEPDTDCTVLLAFNMQSAGNFTGCEPREYVSVMSGVRRIVPKR
jgi:hypothetical protein